MRPMQQRHRRRETAERGYDAEVHDAGNPAGVGAEVIGQHLDVAGAGQRGRPNAASFQPIAPNRAMVTVVATITNAHSR